MVEVRPLALAGVVEITPAMHEDDRGWFIETFSAPALSLHGIDLEFVQDNESFSRAAGTLRGLHYQLPPMAQDKLVRVSHGRILDVAVDIRKASPTYGKWLGVELSAARGNQLLVPKGFAHGFVTLEPGTVVSYKVSAPYSREHDRAISFADPDIGIEWGFPAGQLTLSQKDLAAPLLKAQETRF